MASVFSYKGIDDLGEVVDGSIRAASKSDAVIQLEAKNIAVITITKGNANSSNASALQDLQIYKYIPCSSKSITTFYQQLELLLSAGVPLAEALHSTKVNAPLSLRYIISAISDDVISGTKLSDAMKKHSVFKHYDIALIQAGEESGDFQGVLTRLIDYRENKSELMQSLLTSMIYPIMMVVLTIGIISYLVTKIIPKFQVFLEAKNVQLPEGTAKLIAISNYLRQAGLYWIAGLALLIVALIVLSKFELPGRYIGLALLKIPVIGKVKELSLWINFCWIFSTLLRSGQPLTVSLDLIVDSINNKGIKNKLKTISNSIVNDGISLSKAMQSQKINILMVDSVRVGEQSGALEFTFDKLGKYYSAMLKKRLKLITSLFEPILILTIGSMIGYIYYSFFTLLFTASSSG